MTPTGNWRLSVLRFYWDGEADPSVEVPVADFFASGWGKWDRCALINSLPICVNPRCAFNSYWQMPFHKSCRITMENLDDKAMVLYYQVNYTLADVPGGRGLLPRAVPAREPAQDQGNLHDPGRHQGQGPVRRDLPRGGASTTQAGGARAR
jgi:hypothetical protein